MLSIKSIGKLGLLTFMSVPSGYNSIENLLDPETTTPPPVRSLSPSTVTKELRPGVYLRADIVPHGSDKEVVVLAGVKLHHSNIKPLLNKNVHAVYSGTFFANNISMGDIVGYSVQNPQSSVSKPFKSAEGSRTGRSVHSRFFFGIRHNGTIEIGRRSELKDSNDKPIPSGADLSGEFQSFLGGLAGVNLEDPATRKALLDGDTKKFINQFNRHNRNYNFKAAYEGLDGYRTRARSGIALCEHPQSGAQVIILLSVGDGRSELKGISIMGFARQAMYVAQSSDLIIQSIAIADGGGSMSYFSQNGSSQSSRPPSTAFAVRLRSSNDLVAQK